MWYDYQVINTIDIYMGVCSHPHRRGPTMNAKNTGCPFRIHQNMIITSLLNIISYPQVACTIHTWYCMNLLIQRKLLYDTYTAKIKLMVFCRGVACHGFGGDSMLCLTSFLVLHSNARG